MEKARIPGKLLTVSEEVTVNQELYILINDARR